MTHPNKAKNLHLFRNKKKKANKQLTGKDPLQHLENFFLRNLTILYVPSESSIMQCLLFWLIIFISIKTGHL